MYYGLSSPIEFDLESGLAPMSNVIVQLGSVRFEVTFEDAQNFELIQRLPTEDIYVSAQGEKALPNSDIFLLRYFQLESSEPPLNVFFQMEFMPHDSLSQISTSILKQASPQ